MTQTNVVTYLDNNAATTPIEFKASIKEWPTIAPQALSDSIISQRGPLFFFCGSMVIFFQVLIGIVSEKDLKLRAAMETMGLKSSVYWISWFICYAVLVVANSLICSVLGYIFQFQAFLGSNFGVCSLLVNLLVSLTPHLVYFSDVPAIRMVHRPLRLFSFNHFAQNQHCSAFRDFRLYYWIAIHVVYLRKLFPGIHLVRR